MRNASVQRGLMALYRIALGLGLLRSRPGRWLYEHTYDLYKRYVEARHSDQLAAFIKPGSTVIDVGANTGFFTVRFCRWTGPQGRVIAIEPDRDNLHGLRRRLGKARMGDRVQVIEAGAGDLDGQALLKLNPDHPGDHRLADRGEPIRLMTLDHLLDDGQISPVSLIKIDVQGAEEKVIQGARSMLQQHRPALFVEIDDGALRQMGSGARRLLKLIAGLGYRFHTLDDKGPSSPLSVDQVLAELSTTGPYMDCLCLPDTD
ncbi:MAG TPA: FkbM family methyltransferase [Rhodospirillales bacterium]|nr:FkbM family methyltransferase [Rhodospirillales bacterium]